MTTELQKYARVQTRWMAIEKFLAWLLDQHSIRLTSLKYHAIELERDDFSDGLTEIFFLDGLLAEHFDIDLAKLADERKAMTKRVKASYGDAQNARSVNWGIEHEEDGT